VVAVVVAVAEKANAAHDATTAKATILIPPLSPLTYILCNVCVHKYYI
jgi:hypothetical protein